MTMISTSADALRGAIYGHLVADAIGVPYEFTSPDPARAVELRGHGSHQQPAGTWSDDGALMLALLDSLVSIGWDPDDQARRILAWVDDRAYTPDGDGLFDIGNATMQAVQRLKRGIPATDAGGPPDSDEQGNGSLMRILPIALVDPPADDADLAERAHLASRVTHGALPCQVASALYVFIARALVDAQDAEPETLLTTAVERLRDAYDAQPDHAMELETLLVHRSHLKKPGGGWVLDSLWAAWRRSPHRPPTGRRSSAACASATTPIRPLPSPAASPVSAGGWRGFRANGSKVCADGNSWTGS